MATEKRLIYMDDTMDKLRAYAERKHETGHTELANGILKAANYIHNNIVRVDAVEVVHGHWEKTIDNCTVMHKCSVCGARVVKGFYEYENPNRYCYHCGAKMDGDKDSYGHNADKCDTVTYKGVVLPSRLSWRVGKLMKCKHCDEFTWICVNPDCPMCADVCPVPDTEGVCKFEEREETVYKLAPKGCATVALMDAGLVKRSNDPAIDVFWSCFSELMIKFGYAPKEEDK